MYNQYVKYKLDNEGHYSTMKDYIRDHFEAIVQQLPCVIDRNQHEVIEIACITLGCKNASDSTFGSGIFPV